MVVQIAVSGRGHVAARFAERAHREGADLAYVEEASLMHVYAILPLPEERAARAGIASFYP